ncbi:MAG TPA: 5-(carboxyamino)imidazole ribonucleotide synthase, partial [Kiloniellales bacterium]|nr:5-(carboxyamino)imidazole ribonucleotide synthase [Kiloniellales bacterium]
MSAEARGPCAPLPPGSVIGILGGGQLGRMAAQAAAALGYRSHVYCPEADAPGAQVTPLATVAAYDDEAALARFADSVDLASYEFENIPLETVEAVAARVPVRPGPEVLRICRNRRREKDFCASLGVPTTAHRSVATPEDLRAAVRE